MEAFRALLAFAIFCGLSFSTLALDILPYPYGPNHPDFIDDEVSDEIGVEFIHRLFVTPTSQKLTSDL